MIPAVACMREVGETELCYSSGAWRDLFAAATVGWVGLIFGWAAWGFPMAAWRRERAEDPDMLECNEASRTRLCCLALLGSSGVWRVRAAMDDRGCGAAAAGGGSAKLQLGIQFQKRIGAGFWSLPRRNAVRVLCSTLVGACLPPAEQVERQSDGAHQGVRGGLGDAEGSCCYRNRVVLRNEPRQSTNVRTDQGTVIARK